MINGEVVFKRGNPIHRLEIPTVKGMAHLHFHPEEGPQMTMADRGTYLIGREEREVYEQLKNKVRDNEIKKRPDIQKKLLEAFLKRKLARAA